jgi:hypothetical protein
VNAPVPAERVKNQPTLADGFNDGVAPRTKPQSKPVVADRTFLVCGRRDDDPPRMPPSPLSNPCRQQALRRHAAIGHLRWFPISTPRRHPPSCPCAVLAAVSLGTGRRLRAGWWVVAIGALGTCLIEVVAVLVPTNTLMNSMVQNGIEEGIARELLDRGLYSVQWMTGVWFMVAGMILTFAGAILAIRDRRFRRCELCRAVVRVDSYRGHLNAEHPTGLETP